MHPHQAQPHYAPASVGVLMDPAFLRDAMIDAHGDRRVPAASLVTLLSRWREAIHTVAVSFRRR